MKLEPLMTMKASLGQPAGVVGSVPLGQRSIAEVTGGSFEGERLKGSLVTPGADWIVVGSDGIGHVDVRPSLASRQATRTMPG